MARRGVPLGSVALVGAGPGDPGLITVRGHALLRGADVVVYDRLASTLVQAARPGAELIDVGKTPGKKTRTQAEIDRILVAKARAGKMVVRLKGGDPFVFGRGGEEAESLSKAGVPFEVVPGVSSAIAGPASAGIPVTHRGVATSLVIATAHEVVGSRTDWRALAAADTAVLLMGADRIDEIAPALISLGRAPSTPAAVIADATLTTQRTVTGSLSSIAARAKRAKIRAPAIVVVGDVVKMRATLGGWDTRPLSGVSVLVTRTREQASELSGILRELGALVIEAPAIRVEPPTSWAAMDRAIGRAGTYAWIVFTSANGVRAFSGRLRAAHADARALAGVKICAVGPGTADALASVGLTADLVPPSFTTKSIGTAFPRGSGSVLLARADKAEPGLEEALEKKGWTVDRVIAYRIAGAQRIDPAVRRAIRNGALDVITFASGGTVRAFLKLVGAKVPAKTRIVCIGPVTASEARAAGMKVTKTAKPHTIPALAAAVVESMGSRKRTRAR